MVLTEVVPRVYIGAVDDVVEAAEQGCSHVLSICPGGIGEGKALPASISNHMAIEVRKEEQGKRAVQAGHLVLCGAFPREGWCLETFSR